MNSRRISPSGASMGPVGALSPQARVHHGGIVKSAACELMLYGWRPLSEDLLSNISQYINIIPRLKPCCRCK